MNPAYVLLAAAALAACSSPEAERARGGGPGADTGNRGAQVLMHEGSKPYAATPRIIEQPGPVEPAQQAHRLSSP